MDPHPLPNPLADHVPGSPTPIAEAVQAFVGKDGCVRGDGLGVGNEAFTDQGGVNWNMSPLPRLHALGGVTFVHVNKPDAAFLPNVTPQ